MTDLKDINYKDLPDNERKKLQKQFHENDLNYFSSFELENDSLKKEDLEGLVKTIDKRVNRNPFKFNLNLFIAIGSGIIVGSVLFFIWLYNTKNGIKLGENINLNVPTISNISPVSSNNDTAGTKINNTASLPKEHFNISEAGESLHLSTPMENLDIKDINSVEVTEPNYTPQEEVLVYIPNASVIFIHDLKVANYKSYYFKNDRNIDVRDNGLSAQYSDKEDAKNSEQRLQDQNYYAHEIIKDAMEAFNKKQYTNCVELLDLLRAYNKDDVNAQFYLGMSYYYLSDYKKAKTYLEKASANLINIFLQEAEFYTALCYKNTNKTQEANKLFKEIADKKMFYAKRAEQELN